MAIDEKSYEAGNKAAWRRLLQLACQELGYNDPAAEQAKWISEREAAISALRDVCDGFGDNEWEDNLHLADIIEKHLHRNLCG